MAKKGSSLAKAGLLTTAGAIVGFGIGTQIDLDKITDKSQEDLAKSLKQNKTISAPHQKENQINNKTYVMTADDFNTTKKTEAITEAENQATLDTISKTLTGAQDTLKELQTTYGNGKLMGIFKKIQVNNPDFISLSPTEQEKIAGEHFREYINNHVSAGNEKTTNDNTLMRSIIGIVAFFILMSLFLPAAVGLGK